MQFTFAQYSIVHHNLNKTKKQSAFQSISSKLQVYMLCGCFFCLFLFFFVCVCVTSNP